MRKKYFAILWPFILLGMLLQACGPVQDIPTAFLPSPVTATHTPVPAPTAMETKILMKCEDETLINLGEYRAENNTWGKGDLSGWSQCIGIGTGADGSLVGRWNWDWLNSDGNVKGYPEIIFGQKPGMTTTTKALPIKVNDLDLATVSYDVSSVYTGSGNVAFDIWLTDTMNPTTFSVPPITHEIMIWLDRQGEMVPGGNFKERVSLNGITYAVLVSDNWGDGWRYIAFVSAESRLGAGTLDLGSFFSYLLESGLVTGDAYLASIEFGNEVATGTGETSIHGYSITIKKK